MRISNELQLWAGIEGTVNRVHDRYFSQMARNGHLYRLSDLEKFASLGIKAIRYPVLWELVAPGKIEDADWSWPDERLPKLKELGINPIVGLLHHGSGPRHTSLIDPEFPEKLAEYAAAVAMRYPWVTMYTPVNEPLTTARFSGLYGHWYPHGQDHLTFAKALLNECRGTVLAMRRIREVNPDAKLVQTDDLGRIYSTPKLKYQADYENERRWLTFDLLCGRLVPGMMMWDRMLEYGIPKADLQWFIDNPCPPDVIGINHYLTSDRYLDENLEGYPKRAAANNGKEVYADIEAIRAHPQEYAGHITFLRETYERYKLPVAVTEAHLGSTRDEQMRWLQEIWEACKQLNEEGSEIQAVTVWSLLGAYDWNNLVTKEKGFYEPGVFDLRSGLPRETALARHMRVLSSGEGERHPVLDIPGWWRRPDRIMWPKASERQSYAVPLTADCHTTGDCQRTRPLIIIGATGTLGRAFARICDTRGLPYYLLCRSDLDITDSLSVEKRLANLKPWAVINTAGYVRVDEAEQNPKACWLANVTGPSNLAKACADLDIPFVTFSTDLVFDGQTNRPYNEEDRTRPLNVYGDSKAESERQVLQNYPDSLVIRTSSFFGPWDEHNFVTRTLLELAAGATVRAANDLVVSPTYLPDLVNTTLDLLIDEEHGIWHLNNDGEVSWAMLARLSAQKAKLDPRKIAALPSQEMGYIAKRPGYSAMHSLRGQLLAPLEDALDRYFEDLQVRR